MKCEHGYNEKGICVFCGKKELQTCKHCGQKVTKLYKGFCGNCIK